LRSFNLARLAEIFAIALAVLETTTFFAAGLAATGFATGFAAAFAAGFAAAFTTFAGAVLTGFVAALGAAFFAVAMIDIPIGWFGDH
jgi:hypothetical protein